MDKVKVGDLIIDENGRELRVSQVLGHEKYGMDFMADYLQAAGVDRNGNKVYGNRGFNYSKGNFEIIG